MKISPFLSAMVLFFALTNPLAAEDVQQVFSGIPWGSTVEAFQGVHQSARSGDFTFYKRDKDIYAVGDVALTDIVYGFYKGKFFSVYLKITNPDNVQPIKTFLDKVYDPARAQLRLHETIFIWDYLNVKIKLKQALDGTRAKLAYYYVPLSLKANAARPGEGQDHVFQLGDGIPEYEF
jgi:hypothetical protein